MLPGTSKCTPACPNAPWGVQMLPGTSKSNLGCPNAAWGIQIHRCPNAHLEAPGCIWTSEGASGIWMSRDAFWTSKGASTCQGMHLDASGYIWASEGAFGRPEELLDVPGYIFGHPRVQLDLDVPGSIWTPQGAFGHAGVHLDVLRSIWTS